MEGERPSARIQRNVLAAPERRLLDRLCAACPAWIGPDHLTALGLVGAATVFAGYLGSRLAAPFLALSVFGFVLHWLGDSLDGSLARYRNIERPRYGYFVDHASDAIGNLVMLVGLGLSPYARLDTALLAISGYMLLSIYVFLKKQAVNSFELSFIGMGPTELRVILVAMTLAMPWTNGLGIEAGGVFLSIYDLLLLLAASVFVVLFVVNVTQTANMLRREGR